MDKLIEIYNYAEENSIWIETYNEMNRKALIIKEGEFVAIGLNRKKIKSEREEFDCVRHEMAHYESGAFYEKSFAIKDLRKCEYRARTWEIQYSIPVDKLVRAIKSGMREIWELADHFDCSNDDIKFAFDVYERQGLLPKFKFDDWGC